MALGDHQRVENALDFWGGTSQNNINNLRTNLTRQNQGLENRFNVAADRADRDYGGIQQGYQDFMNKSPISYMPSNQNFGAYGGYQNFADTGGYSQGDIQNIRARSNAPMRATYQNAQNDLDRRNVLAGGNLANYSAAKSQMARNLAIGLGDQSLNTEATLAEAIRNGKLAGLQGMTGIDTSKMGEGLANASKNLESQGMESSRQLSGLSGQTNLYGATPGLANMAGNQMINSSGQQVQTEQLQNQLMDAIIKGTLGMSSVPGNYQSILGNIGSTLGLVGQVGGMIPGLGGLFGGGNSGVSGLPGGTKGPF